MSTISVTVNGRTYKSDVEPRTLLVHYLRDQLNLTGTHIGCDTSQCGACTVMMDGASVKSCTVLAVQADGAQITTIEGLAADGLIKRVDNPRDGRSKLVSLTPEGVAVVHKIQPILDDERRLMLADLSDKELESCADMLSRIFARVARV